MKLYGERITKILNWLNEAGEKPIVSKQLVDAVYRGNINEFTRMRELPLKTRERLIDRFGDTFSTLVRASENTGESATKALLRCQDGAKIEAVSLRFRGHRSLCISSQVGCAFGCSFCESGKVGLKRQLSSSEITDQVFHFRQTEKIGSVSFMGMGEPLSNPKVFEAVSALTNHSQFGIRPSKINISTIGIIPGIKKLNSVHPDVNLAFSLHSPFPDQRASLMPIEKAYPFVDVFDHLDDRIRISRNRIWIAYLLLEGINDTPDHARALVSLIKARPADIRYLYHLNLLPYNPGRTAHDKFRRTTDKSEFQRIIDAANIASSYRNSFGRSIDAACGQLYAEYEARAVNHVHQNSLALS